MEYISEFLFQFADNEDEMYNLLLTLKVTIFNNNGLHLVEEYAVGDYVEDSEHIINEQQMRSDIEYKKFSQKELVKAGHTDYIEDNQYTRKIKKLIREYYDVKDDFLDDLIFNLLDIIRQDNPFKEGLSLIFEVLEIPEMTFMEEYSQAYIQLYNSTSKWILKGYTSVELKPVTSTVDPRTKKKSKVLDFKRKPGRNDPCPCKSGKKYKHCCGNTLKTKIVNRH